MLKKRRKQKGKEDIQRGKANIQEMLTGGNITSRGNEGINRRSGRRDKGTGTRNRREMRARLCDSAPHTQSHTHHCAQPCPDSPRSLSESFPQGSPLCVADLFHSYKWRTCSHASVQYSTDRQQGSYWDARQTFIKSIQPIYYFCFSPIHTKPTRPAAESSADLSERRLFASSDSRLAHPGEHDLFVYDISPPHACLTLNNTWHVASCTSETGFPLSVFMPPPCEHFINNTSVFVRLLSSAWSLPPQAPDGFQTSFCLFIIFSLTLTHISPTKRSVKKLNQEMGRSVVLLIWWVAKEHEM